MTTGIVCGFRAEEKIAARLSPLTAIGWQNPDAARHLIAQGATSLISFGVAGGLDPTLESGDLILPRQLITPNEGTIEVSPDLQELIASAFPGAHSETLYASDDIIDTPAEKQRLFQKTGAIAADMESGTVAEAALQAGIPFAIIRAIGDPASHALPPTALCGLASDGSVDYGAVMRCLWRDPFQLPLLIDIGRRTSKALRTLEGLVPALQPLLA